MAKFISTRDTISAAKQGQYTTSGKSVATCAVGCTTDYRKPCFGFTYDSANNMCIRQYDFDYDLDMIGGAPGMDHYRRVFQCGK